VKPDVFKKAKTPEEKRALDQRNCRVWFRIINWDYSDAEHPLPAKQTDKEDWEMIQE
jgi:hypothetical protein